MAVNIVKYGNQTVIDLTDTTATASDVAQGKYFYGADGVKTEGTATGGGGGGTGGVHMDADGYLVLDSEGEIESLDVDFIDYDGTLLYSYTASDFLAMTALPANPSHEGLIADGWNWDLEGAQEYVEENGFLVIGQCYITDDGKTRFYINVEEDDVTVRQGVKFKQSVAKGVTIDWGDGTTTLSNNTTTAAQNYTHVYSSAGNYVITLTANEECIYTIGYTGANGGTFDDNTISAQRVTKIELGENVRGWGNQPLVRMTRLESISMPNYIPQDDRNVAFSNTYIPMKGLVIPKSMQRLGNANLRNVRYFSYSNGQTQIYDASTYLPHVKKMPIPDTIPNSTTAYIYRDMFDVERVNVSKAKTALQSYYFTGGISIKELTIPANVESIADRAFTDLWNLRALHMKPTTPPTLGNARTFNDYITSARIIYVPYSEDHSILEAYQTATNWSTLASYMQEEDPND